MKQRTGFVTNSSSSNFLIVGVGDSNIVSKLLSGCGISDVDELDWGYGVAHDGDLGFYGYDDPPYRAGLDIEDLLENMNIKQLRIYFQKYVKDRFNFEIPIDSIDLHYGEVGD